MDNWRPKDWENPYRPGNPKEGCDKETLYEAGADAILEGVRKQPVIHGQIVRNMLSTNVKWYDSVTASKNGQWYFIPDEQPR